MDEPESKSALATTCLHPPPPPSTLLVIIKQWGGANDWLIDWIGLSKLGLAAFTLIGLTGKDGSGSGTTGAMTLTDAGARLSLWIKVWCLPPHCLHLAQLLQSRP